MTEKNIFVYKLFLSVNISDFTFFVKIETPLKKVTPSFLATPSQSWGPFKPPPPIFENLVQGLTSPPAEREVGWVHTMYAV